MNIQQALMADFIHTCKGSPTARFEESGLKMHCIFPETEFRLSKLSPDVRFIKGASEIELYGTTKIEDTNGRLEIKGDNWLATLQKDTGKLILYARDLVGVLAQ